MNGNNKKCHNLSKAKKCNNNFPTNTIGKKPNEKMINTIIDSKIDPVIDPKRFFDLFLASAIIECNYISHNKFI